MRGAATGGPDPEVPDEEVSDRVLLQRCRSGESAAAERVYRRYAPRLRALVSAHCSRNLRRRVKAEDIVQATFLAFFAGVAAGHFEVREGGGLWSLLMVIALNEVRAAGLYHRARKRDVRRTIDGAAAERGIRAVPVADHAPHVLLRLTLGEAFDRLPPRHRAVIELRAEGYEVAEIAARVRRSKRTVERVLEQFRRRFADRIGRA